MSFGPGKRSSRTAAKSLSSEKDPAEFIRDLKKNLPVRESYRERSLAIHGLICARCGREFEPDQRSLLTVHHKDGNPLNNPPDGSNWENLCTYCHEDTHSRELLGEYLDGKE
jgi:predicted amidophosphoribosyltransferase